MKRQAAIGAAAALLLAACGSGTDDTLADGAQIVADMGTESEETDRLRDDPDGDPTMEPGGRPTAGPTSDAVSERPDGPDGQPDEHNEEADPHPEVRSATTITMAEGQTVTFRSLDITLVRATAPDPDECQDCPLEAVLEVANGTDTERLVFRFSGNMPADTAEEARTAEAFGHIFRVERVILREADLRID